MELLLIAEQTAPAETRRYYGYALALSIFTVGYNILEGLISTWLGFADESLALFGFGADSFIEVLSGVGILHLVLRIRRNDLRVRDDFERTALRITGTAFYLLCGGLVATAGLNISAGSKPESTVWGVVVALVSIAVMHGLASGKTIVGKKLGSAPVLADANCTRVCIYMSYVLLASSAVFELTGFAYADSIGSLGLVWFAWREGRECFHKARTNAVCCDADGCHA